MRIALLSAEYPPAPGGIGDYTQHLGRALFSRGHALSVWTTDSTGWVAVNPESGSRRPMPLLPLNKAQPWGWRAWRSVLGLVAEEQPDILHIQYQTGAYGMHPAINFLPWRVRRVPNRPRIIVTAHDLLEPYLFPKAGPLRRHVTFQMLADADAVVVTNGDDLERVIKAKQFAVAPRLIPIGSNIAVAPPAGYERMAWRARLGVGEEETLVAYFGLMGRSKGVDMLVAAIAQLPREVKLLIIGGEATAPQDVAYRAQVLAQIEALNLAERVITTGHVDEQDVSAYLLTADVAALPFDDGASFRRGSLLAALAHGLPVVTTWPKEEEKRRQAEGEIHFQFPASSLRNGEHVMLVPPGEPAALAAAISQLAEDSELRKRLGLAGKHVASALSWPSIAEQHEQLYTQLLATRS